MTHYRDTTNDISTQPLAPELPVEVKERRQAQAPTENPPVYRNSEKRLGCHAVWRNEGMSRKPSFRKAPKQPLTEIDLRYRIALIALVALTFVLGVAALMGFLLGAATWVTAISSGGCVSLAVFLFYKTLGIIGGRS